MQNINNNDDADQMARQQAALAAQARARQAAGGIAAAHAAGAYAWTGTAKRRGIRTCTAGIRTSTVAGCGGL